MRILGLNISRAATILAIAEAILVLVFIYLLSLTTYGQTVRWIVSWVPATMVMIAAISFGVYESVARSDLDTHRKRAAVSSLIGIVLSYIFFYVFTNVWMSPLYAIAAGLTAFAVLTFARLTAQKLAKVPSLRNRVILLGDDKRIEKAENIITRLGSGASVFMKSLIDDPELPAKLSSVQVKREIQEIVVSSAIPLSPELLRALFDCKSRGISVVDDITYIERETGQVDLDRLYAHTLVFNEGFQVRNTARFIKRTIDILLSSFVLVLLIPIFLIVSAFIALDSKGGVFYKQTRTGLQGKPFEIYKFRSMRQDAEAKDAPQWAQEEDPRITRIGKFIRKTRIDELPQLINILKGEMSIVGPRPERPYFVEQLSKDIPFYNDRHRVKPGLTGWAQINYQYGSTSDDAREKLKYDLYYMKNFSVILDIVIMIKTARVVLWPDGVH